MKKCLTVFFALMLILILCAVPVFAAESADCVFLPMDWIEKRQTDAFVSSKLETFADAGVVNIYVTVASYSVEKTESGMLQVNSSVSLTSLAKWIREADARGMNIYASVHIEAGEFLLATQGKQNPSDLIGKQAKFLAEKLLVSGISYNGTAYTADGMLLSGCDFTGDYAAYYSGILEAWRELESGGSIFCMQTDAENAYGADFADAALLAAGEIPEEPLDLAKDFDSVTVVLPAANAPANWAELVQCGAEQIGVTVK